MSRKMYSLFIPFNNTILIEMTLDMYLTVSNQRRIQHRTLSRLEQLDFNCQSIGEKMEMVYL